MYSYLHRSNSISHWQIKDHHGWYCNRRAHGDVYDCRTFSGKVRKLKQHRRASASRLRPPGAPPSPPGAPYEAPSSSAVIVAPVTAVTERRQQQQHADEMQSQSSTTQQACQAQHAQQAQQHSSFEQQALQQLPLLVQQPGFDEAEKKLEQQRQLLDDRNVPPQLVGQVPLQLQQQPTMTRVGRRQRPTADAAGLACFGMGVQEAPSRMTQSGLLHPSAVAPAPFPELFEVSFVDGHVSAP